MNFEANIKRMFSEFTEGQKDWFRFEFPLSITEWVQGGFNGKQLSKNPELLEDYLDKSVSISAQMPSGALDRLLIALWCVRKCHGPIQAPTLYRLTRIRDLKPGAKQVVVKATNSLKPITSWSSREDVVVHDRKDTLEDYVIRAENVPSKFILSSADVLSEFIQIVFKNSKLFDLSKKPDALTLSRGGPHPKVASGLVWNDCRQELKSYSDEKEYLVYLHPHESIKATVVRKKERDIDVRKRKLEQRKLDKKNLPNPFLTPGLKSLTPKAQVALLHKTFKTLPRIPSNRARLVQLDEQLRAMIKYADLHHITIF